MTHDHADMNCPRCSGVKLRPVLTKQGVEVDYCDSCGGIWLDKGEIFYFAKSPKPLIKEMRRAVKEAKPGMLASPKTGKPMRVTRLFDQVEIDYDPENMGIWLDKGELQQILQSSEAKLELSLDEAAMQPAVERGADGKRDKTQLAAYASGARALPNMFVRSASCLVLLYGLLGVLLIFCVEFAGLGAGVAVIIGVIIAGIQFLVGPWFMDLSLKWFYHCSFVDPGSLPEHLNKFVTRVTSARKMKYPRFGIIDDGAPNAFTYGHTPNNARIVITRGLFNLLDEEELEAVVAHEIGHAAHWDMLIMTVAYLVPLIAYYIYRTLIRIRVRGRDRSAAARYAIALGAFVVYIISQYIVLWLSRTREYRADHFAGDVTRNPNFLSSALVKIGYGLAGQEKAKGAKTKKSAGGKRKANLEAIGALGIFDSGAARALAVSSVCSAGAHTLDPEQLKCAMRWDVWNPWAKWYELNSTHPLIANRIEYMSRQAAQMGLEPLVVFDHKKPESYWDEFLVDLFMMFLPWLMGLGLLAAGIGGNDQRLMLLAISGFGAGMLFKTLFSYRGGAYPELNVASLLKKVKVSGVRGVPCTIEGTVIGRGVPGLIWSEDFVIQDETGIMFLDYRQPIRIFEFLFGLLRRGQLEGERVVAKGWYRRAPVPFIELKTLKAGGKTRRCYVYHMKLIVSVLLVGLGIFLMINP
jgi:Zn-dependent protease with chaperone function